jgi:hypothetical protein
LNTAGLAGIAGTSEEDVPQRRINGTHGAAAIVGSGAR